MTAGCFGQFLRVIFTGTCTDLFVKDVSDFFLLQVDSGHRDVAWRLTEELYDAFTEVCVYRFNATLLERWVEVALLGKGGFALDEPPHRVRFENVQYVSVVLFSVNGPEQLYAVGCCRLFKLNEISIEIG